MEYPTRTQIQDLVTDYLRLERELHPRTVCAFDISREIRERYGIRIDWHVAADQLEYLTRTGEITQSGYTYDNHTSYNLWSS